MTHEEEMKIMNELTEALQALAEANLRAIQAMQAFTNLIKDAK